MLNGTTMTEVPKAMHCHFNDDFKLVVNQTCSR